jgi:hypothetical protein
MKNLKYVKTFESFKINEEVPYNYDLASEMVKTKWTESEISDLEKIGASNIKDSTALIDQDSLVVFITKNKQGYKINTNEDIMTFDYDLKPNISGRERTPDRSDIDYSKKTKRKLQIPNIISDWSKVLETLDIIFKKHKFGWDYSIS